MPSAPAAKLLIRVLGGPDPAIGRQSIPADQTRIRLCPSPGDRVRGAVCRAAEAQLSPEAADAEILRRAVHRTRSDELPFLPDGGRVLYGLRAMAAWAEQLQRS